MRVGSEIWYVGLCTRLNGTANMKLPRAEPLGGTTYLNVAREVDLHLVRELECSDVVVGDDTRPRTSSLRGPPPVSDQLLFPVHTAEIVLRVYNG
jgi:hypothetical protein